ncbi:MAG: hypothetical protein C0501_19805 [Isosphaera sp.]|nr:hypothetical protein [Isosphaera sp.]
MARGGRHSADDLLAAELAAGQTVRDAARTAGVSEHTAHRRNGDPAFKARVAELRVGMVAEASGRLAESMGRAANVLRDLLGSADEKVRLRAAERMIELGLKVVELTELQRRVEELERQAAGGTG